MSHPPNFGGVLLDSVVDVVMIELSSDAVAVDTVKDRQRFHSHRNKRISCKTHSVTTTNLIIGVDTVSYTAMM